MATILAVSAVWALILVGHRYLPRLIARIRARRRTVECTGCGHELRASRAVRVGATYADVDGGPGGTAVSTDWHRRCARRAGVT